jgi:phosphoribosylformylglycinamidine synthase subunit PurS
VAVTTGAAQATGQTSRSGRRWLARVQVTLKPVVNDPAGLSIGEALKHLGFDGLEGVRVGKYFEIELRAADRAEAEAKADAMCRQLLANPVVEEYAVTVGRPRARR